VVSLILMLFGVGCMYGVVVVMYDVTAGVGDVVGCVTTGVYVIVVVVVCWCCC